MSIDQFEPAAEAERRQAGRRSADRRLESLEVAIEAVHTSHQVLTQQMVAVVLAQEKQTKALEKLTSDMPRLFGEGFATGFRAVTADPKLMQDAGRGLLGALGDIGTQATGNAVVGWAKGLARKLIPVGLLLGAAWAVGGPAMLGKVAAWYIKTFGSGG